MHYVLDHVSTGSYTNGNYTITSLYDDAESRIRL